MDTKRAILGNTHPDTLVSIENIGRVLETQGNKNMISSIDNSSPFYSNLLLFLLL